MFQSTGPYRSQIDFPVVYDWEDIGVTHARTYKLNRDILDACALTFCGEIEGAGYQPMIYFYQYLGEERYHLDVIDRYPFWYCYYKEIYPKFFIFKQVFYFSLYKYFIL